MNGLMNWIEKRLAPAAARISEQRHLASIRDGLALTMAFLIIGSMVVMILNIPITGWADLGLIKFLKPYGVQIWDATLGIVALLATFGIGASLAQRYKMDGTIGGLMSVVALFAVTPELTKDWGVPFHTAGWLFTGMLIAIGAVEVMHWFIKRKIVIRMPDGVPPAVGRSFAALLPGIGVLVLAVALRGAIHGLFGIGVNDIVLKIFEPLKFLGGSLIGVIVAVLLVHVLWSVGIHGGNVALGIFGPIFLAAATENANAFAAGQAAPHIVTGPFLDIFVYVGGAGTTFSLAVLMLFWARSKQLKSLGRLSVGPAIFNINEPILFGSPIIMNPVLLVPFIVTPVVLTIITYLAMASGIVGRTVSVAPWTSPVIMGGFLSTGDWKAVILQLVNVAVAGAIYYPFFRAYDKMKLSEETGAANKTAA